MFLVETRKKFHDIRPEIDGLKVRFRRGRRELCGFGFLSFVKMAKCREEREEILGF